ncbi:type III pantothenate kinase [Methyloversatilis sp.]|uniref:type III pantothenate kinase n=1 Tax=Methyloversatilis sp. TaxID=2569862 RepID=UPI0027352290|nr:type III pantothenate kinase [Methyloversatilis sp.]MDP2870539.1 type III pantothenate kinase [Methyloversatilis sp.]MDP3289255.1 type III pantothenate kinase [Methyloversatilis sp.]MDP3455422.1 type III pantothenate kinase [Methyloversatilis sp.]MDP3578081.1 type III pantothenate kinase [Methyloversatilis sp.]
MQLLIDAGNSRIKWAWSDAGRPGAVSAVDLATFDVATLAHAWQVATAAHYTCVAGDAVDAAIRRALPSGCAAHRVFAGPSACGIANLYDQPARLGADRWAALIGARALHAGPLVVATAGTATTIDALDADDRFIGGYILPGLRLMLESLARHTADLPHAAGHAADWPRNTDDAIHNACTDAQAALIERIGEQLGPQATVLLSGGAASAIAPRLRCAHQRVDDLVLHGLARLAAADKGPDVMKCGPERDAAHEAL